MSAMFMYARYLVLETKLDATDLTSIALELNPPPPTF